MSAPKLTDADLREVAGAFGADRDVLPRLVETGTVNPNYVAVAGTGRVVLRLNVRNPDRDRIAQQIAFQEHLREGGFPVPEVLPPSEPGSKVLEHQTGLWTASRFVDGDPFDFDRPAHVAEAAARLAELHTLLQGFGRSEVPERGRVWGISWVAGHARQLRSVEEALGRDEDSAPMLDEQAALVDEIVGETPSGRVAELPVAWTHGDYHGLNLIFQGETLAALIDFDSIHVGTPAEDVARGVFSFGRQYRGSTVLRPDVVRAFLSTYQDRRPLTRLELAFVPAFVALYWTEDALHVRRYAAMGRDPREEMRRKLPILRALVAQAGLVASICDELS